jgi:glycosyltransferase involved in cell wall biosynthesis
MPNPLVSAIIGVRDGEGYLGEALDSIAEQCLKDLEVIVVDDGSKDASADIAAGHSISPRVLSQGPLGVGAALNSGIRLARGRYLAFLDCDDVWPKGRLDLMIGVIGQDSAIDGVLGKAVNTDKYLNAISSPQPARVIGAWIIKRTSALKIGEFRTDVAHAAIMDWSSRANHAGLKFKTLNEVVLLRRIHGANLGIRDRSRARVDLLQVIRDHHKRMGR